MFNYVTIIVISHIKECYKITIYKAGNIHVCSLKCFVIRPEHLSGTGSGSRKSSRSSATQSKNELNFGKIGARHATQLLPSGEDVSVDLGQDQLKSAKASPLNGNPMFYMILSKTYTQIKFVVILTFQSENLDINHMFGVQI